jgi:multidrug resistance efflux pump
VTLVQSVRRTVTIAGFPLCAWAFALRTWAAMMVALYAAFWLQLENASSAATTVGILALQTRGQAYQKAVYRVFATIIGVVASFVIAGMFPQTRELFIVGFAGWLGLCVYAGGLLDGNRTYGGVLSGYAVALVAVTQIDSLQNVFWAGVNRGAAIVVGIAALALVSDFFAAPNIYTGLAGKLTAAHGRVHAFALAILRGGSAHPIQSANLLREITALHPDITALAAESSHGWARGAAAQSAAVALVAKVRAAGALASLPATTLPSLRKALAEALADGLGEETEVRVVDNQFVHQGDVLYVTDPFDFRVALDTAKAQLRQNAADLQVKRMQADRRLHLSELATTAEEQQQFTGAATQAQAAFDSAQQQVAQADINLKRTQVRSPVNGYVTNLLMRVGDYAHVGVTNISVIDADSYWIDAYFEETKMAHVCVGDRAEAVLMGYRDPIVGRVESVTRGISVSNAAPSTQGLPNVDPVYTWVRLAQRVPVRIRITNIPAGVPLVSGMTVTVTIRDAEARERGGWRQRFASLPNRLGDIVHGPQPSPGWIPRIGDENGATVILPTPKPAPPLNPEELNPGLAPGMNRPPQAFLRVGR